MFSLERIQSMVIYYYSLHKVTTMFEVPLDYDPLCISSGKTSLGPKKMTKRMQI